MTSFASDVYKSTAEKSPDDYDAYSKLLKDRANAAWKNEGSISGRFAPKTSLAEQGKAKDTYDTGEYNRRTAAVGQESKLAGAEDARIGSVADRVRDALYNRQQLQTGFETQQSQADRLYGQGVAELQQGASQKMKEQDFTAYKNAADRSDAMSKAYDDGILEMQILDANRTNGLKMADVERYWALEKNRFDNQTKDFQMMSEQDAKNALQAMQTQAQGGVAMLDALLKMTTTVTVDQLTT